MMYHKKRLLRQTFFAWQEENSPSHLALLDASPLGDGALDMAGKLPDKLQSFRHARGSLSEGAGKTVRF